MRKFSFGIKRRSIITATIFTLVGVLLTTCVFTFGQIGAQNLPTSYSEGGPQPGAPDYTVFTFTNDTGTFYAAKNSFGHVEWSSSISSTVFNNVISNSDNKKIYVANGNYVLDSAYPGLNFTGRTGIIFVGESRDGVVFTYTGSTWSSTAEPFFDTGHHIANFTFADFTINANGFNSNGGNIFHLHQANNSRIVNLHIYNGKLSGVNASYGIADGSSNIIIQDCEINNVAYGIYQDNGENNTITRNNIHNCGVDGIQLQANCRNNLVEENQINSCPSGINLDAAQTDNTLYHNTISGASSYGISLTTTTGTTQTGTTIAYNGISSCGTAVLFWSNGTLSATKVESNTFASNTKGIDYEVYSAGTISRVFIDKANVFTSNGADINLPAGAQVSNILQQSGTGLVGHWKFDEAQGTVAYDSSGYGNTGTVNSSTAWGAGKYAAGLTFNGATDYVGCGNATNTQLTSTGTVAAWVKLTAATGTQILVCKMSTFADRNGYELYTNGNKFYGEIASGAAYNNVESTATLTAGTWAFVVFTWDGSNLRLYKDGVSAATPVAQTVNAVSLAYTLNFGKNAGADNTYLGGSIDNIQICNYAMSQAEIWDMWALGPPSN